MADAEKGPIRFVMTHLNNDGARTLTDPRQGRFTYETREEAQERVDMFRPSYARRPELDVNELEVRSVECWPGHFDPKTCWFDLVEEGQRWYHKHGRDHYVTTEELASDAEARAAEVYRPRTIFWFVRDSNPPPRARQPRLLSERALRADYVLESVDQRDRR